MAKKAKPLLIVESPTKAQTIRRLLGDSYEVTASQGHVRDLPEKGKGVKIEKGTDGYHFIPTYQPVPKKEGLIHQIREEVKKASQVWLATDEDREGEAIAWHLCSLLDLDPESPLRIAFHEITQKALKNALQNPRPINLHLVNAQQARRVLDRLVGYEISPLLWRTFPHKKGQGALSAGRVQSVALRLLVERERAIAEFRPTATLMAEVYMASTPSFKATLVMPELPDFLAAIETLSTLREQALLVLDLEKKQRRRNPPPPFTTSTLQQEAQRRLGFSLQRTMRAAQSLYEKGLITYMRTDSVQLAQEAVEAIHQAVRERYGEAAVQPRIWSHSKSVHAQEAHEAIRPTDPGLPDAGDTPDEQKLYSLIWRRTLACQMREALYEETLALLVPSVSTSSSLRFEAKGRILVQPGFLELYGYLPEEEEEATLPPLQKGQLLPWERIRIWEKFSSPPPRYTEGTLVKELEERGIGRPSTYAPTVETLFKRNYIKRENIRVPKPSYQEAWLYPDGKIEKTRCTPAPEVQKNKLLPTELGIRVIDFLLPRFPDIMDYAFTARIESELDQIANAELDWQEMLNAFYDRFTAEVAHAQETRHVYQHRLLGYHPITEKPISLHLGRNGPFVAMGEKGDPNHKTASIPDSLSIENLTLEQAIELLSFPRSVGDYEGEPITIHSGPYGYYLKHGGKNYPLLPGMSPFSLSIEEAIEAIETKRKNNQGPTVLRTFPEAQIEILQGKYGPYIRYPGGSCSLPKGTSPHTLTLADCEKLIESKKQRIRTPASKRKKGTKSRSGGK
ncbi:MAG: type I DNA topoisomerase [Bacteroidia bacterium]|nr:type I DNA topoisomerase [Bacteroidia bacterium]